jgi:surface-anchored protein
MTRSKYVSWLCIAISCLQVAGRSTWAQGHSVKAFKDVTLYFGIETSLPDPNHPISVDLYHTDFEVSFRTTGWDPMISYDGPGTGANGLDINLQEALLYGNTNSRWVLSSVPAGYGFIGAKPGQPFWILPQNSGTGALPLGFAAERADTSRLRRWNPHDSRGADDGDLWFEVRLLKMQGPADANFALWQADGISAPVVFMSTHDWGVASDKNTFYISSGSHVHLNWGFTQRGSYAISFRISTVLYGDEELTADWAPPGDSSLTYYGDGRVDLQDLTWLVAQWGKIPSSSDPNTFMFYDPSHPTKSIGTTEMNALAGQWLKVGYPGCDPPDANSFDPNDLIKLLNR